MISNNHPLMRSLIRHSVPHLWCDNVLFWHHMDMSSPPAASMYAWINGGARQVAFTHSSDAVGKNVYDERLKQVVNVKQNRIGFGCQLEPARTNQIGYSAATADWWIQNNVVAIDENTADPMGGSAGIRLTCTVDSHARLERNFGVPVSDTKYTFSVYAKAGNSNYVGIGHYSPDDRVSFNLSTGSINEVGSFDSSGMQYVGNGWWRCWVVLNVLSSAEHNLWKVLQTSSSDPSDKIVGDYCYIWGMQLEEGGYPSSYIPTSGTEVTRTADTMRLINADMFGRISEKGSILWVGELPYKPSEIASDAYILGLNDGDVATDCLSFNVDATGDQIDVEYESSGGNDGAVNGATLGDVAAGTPVALCAAWSGNDLRYYANGVSEGQDTSLVPSTALDRLEIGGRISTDGRVGGQNFAILCFDRALTERECLQLTKNPEVWKWGA